MITIYTDGSSRGNPGPGGWGAVLVRDDKVVEIGGSDEHTTNNRMELTACIRALEFTISNFQPARLGHSGGFSKIQINTDSEYVMKGITEWVKNWQKKGWKTANKKPVLNQDLWQKLLELTGDKKIEWKYVAGHAGVRLNERADEIATDFADDLAPDLYNGPRDKYR